MAHKVVLVSSVLVALFSIVKPQTINYGYTHFLRPHLKRNLPY